jgi:DNA (cytosine-5)-methyltransferase 1
MSRKPVLLDLFCGAGGSARGYADAGFEVVGVDSVPQPRYPFAFIQADALTYPLDGFDVIHCSPPCQEYSQSRFIRNIHASTPAPKLIAPIRERLEQSGMPWVIENVAFSDIPDALILCGSMFGLPIRRHRWFASSHLLFAPMACQHTPEVISLVGNKVRGYGTLRTTHQYKTADGGKKWRESYLTRAEGRAAMGIDWMTIGELCQAVPPPYTEWIGGQLIEYLKMDRQATA